MPRCEECGESLEDNGFCSDCDELVWCTVCKTWLHDDEALYDHRHIFWDTEYGLWLGAGGDDMTDRIRDAHIKKSFFAVLRKTGLAEPLRRALQANKIALQYWPNGIYLCLPDESGHACDYGECFPYFEDTEITLGVGWLGSLYDDETEEANALTLQWIAEFEAQEKEAAICRTESPPKPTNFRRF